MVELQNVSKVFPPNLVALDQINLTVEKGDMIFITGPSGAGKSTLLELLYRAEIPTQGRVVVDGRDLARLKHKQIPFLRRTIGTVFQDYKLLPRRTVAENVLFSLEVIGVSEREAKKRMRYVLELVNLIDKANLFPSELSGGEQQRVSIARALANNPPLFLADEPTGNLDWATSWELMELLKQVNLQGTTVIMATHNEDIVRKVGCHTVILERGKIVSETADAKQNTQPPLS
ncbi:MAG: cell division ATP-binding protein FtsE [Coprothermobacterota bacterium]|nr:cell division ATP-binding protein FtsE [Coprothermobacterota bacterium]